MSPPLYPLRFEPLLKRYLWGGRRLETELGKSLGAGNDYAESWELVDRPQDQSRVSAGPLRGTTLGDLVRERGAELLGRHDPQPRFPLLIKFLDARQTLSVQVHPDDAQAAVLVSPDLGKTEAWVVLAAEPGSLIYAGLKRGFDRPAFERELRRGTCTASSRVRAIVCSCPPVRSTPWAQACWWPRFSNRATRPIGSTIGTASGRTASHGRCTSSRRWR